MKEYHKIQTLYKRDLATNLSETQTSQRARGKKVIRGKFSLPVFEYLARNEWTFSEKIDGCNIRVMVNSAEQSITFGGKTDAAQIPATLVQKLQELFLSVDFSKDIFEKFPDGACLYGEGYGAKIQKGGGNYRPDQSFVLFDVNIDGWWLERPNVEEIAHALGLEVVPIIGTGDLLDMTERVVAGFNSRWGEFPAEGIVARPRVELKSRSGERIITKLKHKDF